MKLPEIEYQIPLNNPVQQAGAPFHAAKQLTDTMAAGLTMLGQERIKTQTQEAGVELSEGLAKAEQDIKRRQFISPDEVVDILGPDNIPENVKPYLEQAAGPGGTDAPAQIPMYEVGDAIFAKRAKELVGQTSKRITVDGWQAEYQEKAEQHVADKAHQLALHNLQAASSYLQAQQENQAERLWNAGDFVGARSVIASSNAIPPAQKEKLLEKVLVAEQTKPIADALIAGDRKGIEEQIARIRAEKDVNALDPEKRASFEHTLQVRLDILDREAEQERVKAQQRRYDRAMGQIANLELAASKSGGPFDAKRAFALIPMDDSISGEQRKNLVSYVQATQKPPGERKTDLALYQGLRFFAAENPEAFQKDEILIPDGKGGQKKVGLLSLAGGLSDSDFKSLVGMQTEMREKGINATRYRSFMDEEQLVNTKLRTEYGYDLKTINQSTQAEIGRLKQMVDGALRLAEADNGGRLTIDQRNQVVDKVLRAEVKVEKHTILSDTKKLATAGVDPEIAVVLRHHSERSGHPMTDDEIIATHKDFGWYEGGLAAAWSAQSTKPMSTEDALGAYMVLRTKWAEIDHALVTQGLLKPDQPTTQAQKDAANRLRSAAAVQLYLKGVR